VTLPLALYRAATGAGRPLIEALLRRRLERGREDPERAGERRGIAGRDRPTGPLVWLHAASVGEALSVLTLIDRLLERPLGVLVTSGTVTSAHLLAERLPDRVLHQYVPVDRPAWVARFLDHWRPDLALWVESELWPNLLTATHDRGVPLVLVNARMSARSHARWRRAPRTAAALLALFDLALAQDEAFADRLRDLGARHVAVAGNLKLAAAPLPADPDALATLQVQIGARPRWLAASLHPGEDGAVWTAHEIAARTSPDLLTVAVPRHPHRGPEFAAAARARGLTVALRSAGDPVAPDTAVYVADGMGELGLFYRLADIVFVGGSLILHGGQNLLEPAQLASALLHGPSTDNFASIVAALDDVDGSVRVADGAELGAAITRLLADPAEVARLAEAAAGVAAAQAHVLDDIAAHLEPYLDRLAAPALAHARA